MNKPRMALYLVAAAALAALVTALVGLDFLAIALLVVTLVGMFGWVLLWARRTNSTLGRIEDRLDRLARAGTSAAATDVLRADIAAVGQRVDRVRADQDRAATRAYRDVANLSSLVQRTPSLTNELGRIYERLVQHDRPMLELGGWAMTPSTLLYIIDLIWSGRVSQILECGSGSSTVWFALALEQRGGAGRIVSLESSPEYAEQTRRSLAELGLGHRAEVLTAELATLELPDRDPQPWFDASVLPDDAVGMDLLFVDGPVGSIAREARYPALPVLAPRLADDPIVVLDDSGRTDERRIIEQWSSGTFAGRRYRVLRELDRATAFGQI